MFELKNYSDCVFLLESVVSTVKSVQALHFGVFPIRAIKLIFVFSFLSGGDLACSTCGDPSSFCIWASKVSCQRLVGR